MPYMHGQFETARMDVCTLRATVIFSVSMTVYSPGYESWIVIRLSSAAALRDSDQDATQTHIQLRYAVDRSTTVVHLLQNPLYGVLRCAVPYPLSTSEAQ